MTRHFDDSELVDVAEARHAVITAALDLFGLTDTESFVLRIPRTNPPLYVMAGEAMHIDEKLIRLGVVRSVK